MEDIFGGGGENDYICGMMAKYTIEDGDASCEGAAPQSIEPALYLMPSTMADGRASDVLPQRNIDLCRHIRHYVVENVRTARRFLKRVDPSIDINALTFDTLNEHTRPDELPAMLAPLEAGEAVAVVSEAGCPAIADPGSDLVAAASRRGFKVVPLVGPSSIILSLMASGFNGQSFAFVGYLPVESDARAGRLREMLRRIERERQTQIFIETPYRNNRLVAELVAALPPHVLLCVATDLTGPDEKVVTRPLSEWAKAMKRGEQLAKIPSIFLLFS